jgi:hypothetical protein
MAPTNWREYLTDRFAGDARLTVVSGAESNLVTVKSGDPGTEIEFRFNGVELQDVDFLNDTSPGWCRWVMRERAIGEGLYDNERAFTAENVAQIEEWIAVPLYAGWTEEAYYDRSGEHVKSVLRWTQGGKDVQITQYMSDIGCLLRPLQAISQPIREQSMKTRTIVIRPMIEAAQQRDEADER